jgi:ribosome-associated protein
MDGLRVGSVVIGEEELSERFSRSGGPGGQHVNTSDTKVELRWDVAASQSISESQRDRLVDRLGGRLNDGVLAIVASEYRSQWRNREAARARLAALLAESLRPPSARRRPTRASRRSQEARLATKKRRAQIKRARGRPTSDS